MGKLQRGNYKTCCNYGNCCWSTPPLHAVWVRLTSTAVRIRSSITEELNIRKTLDQWRVLWQLCRTESLRALQLLLSQKSRSKDRNLTVQRCFMFPRNNIKQGCVSKEHIPMLFQFLLQSSSVEIKSRVEQFEIISWKKHRGAEKRLKCTTKWKLL